MQDSDVTHMSEARGKEKSWGGNPKLIIYSSADSLKNFAP